MQPRRFVLLGLAVVTALSVAVPATATDTFTDVPDTNVFSADIQWLEDAGITQGCNPPANDRFCPTENVTREQMAAFLVRSLGLTDNGGGNTFTDDDGSLFENDIAKLAAAGITQGCNPPTNDRFCPTENVTREQMAAFLVRSLGLTDNGGGNTFTDDDGSVFENDIAKLAAAGITQGCNPPTNDRFCPTENVTREQMAAFLHRSLDPAPNQVQDLIVTLSGGSNEIDVSWEPNPEGDIASYNVWFSELPGGTKAIIPEPYTFGPATSTSGRWYIIDWPRAQTSGETCYQVSAVDASGQEGPRSVEECFDSTPGAPTQVMGVTVGLGGGSGEVFVSWDPNPEGDIASYNAYFSEFPGGPYTYVPEPYF
ncbi:Beta-galactosidase, partial [hydrothermal vent metagenome]